MGILQGYLEVTSDGGRVVFRVYGDASAYPAPMPLVNGPRGYCLDITNTSGRPRKVIYKAPGGTEQTLTVNQGDPVANRSMTVTQLNNAGFFNLQDFSNFTLQ